MAVLTSDKMSGPVHRASTGCGCGKTVCTCAEKGGQVSFIPSQDPCTDSAAQTPVETSEYQCSLAVTRQAAIDSARRRVHELGFRPYRVFLVWANRQSDRTIIEYHRAELMPVKVLSMNGLELVSSDWGEDLIGGIALAEISPQQVTEDTLRGYIDGEDWQSKSTEREFFYEIALHERCAGEIKSRRRRFYQATEPNLDALRFQFTISIGQQNVERSRDGIDQTIGTVNPDGTPLLDKPRLVT